MNDTLETRSGTKTVTRKVNVRRDTLDFRDRMFEASLVEVPVTIPLESYRRLGVPVLDQGQEGACTGFGLATVANYLLSRRKVVPDRRAVSARMLYDMARRYDEWPGDDYSGSSARGAMKGWQKHGVCLEATWPYEVNPRDGSGLTRERSADARARPLGAYLRVNHKDLVAMHSAIAEVGILYATATVHEGWSNVDAEGRIPWPSTLSGGHAFAIVAYDAEGFWIQNSWGTGWGTGGFARISYDDWLLNGTDVWVARLGVPVVLREASATAEAHSAAARSASYSIADLRPHVVSLGNDGKLLAGGDYGKSPDELRRMIEVDMAAAMAHWPQRHVVLYAHGGLVTEREAVQRLAEHRSLMLPANIYPVSFVWHSGFWTTMTNILQDAMRRRRPEGVFDAAKDFLLDRLDDTLEVLARPIGGKAAWDEMKENATGASAADGGALAALQHLAALHSRMPFQLHLVGHSAGSIFLAPLVRLLTARAGRIGSGYLRGRAGLGLPVQSCTLWAPACTTDLFKQAYLPSIRDGGIARFSLFALDDETEQDDHCARIYNKSLLYLVSRSFEASGSGPGTPLLGMEKWIAADPALTALFTSGRADLVFASNNDPEGLPTASRAKEHGAFDDDEATVKATIARVLGVPSFGRAGGAVAPIRFHAGDPTLRSRRELVNRSGARPG